MSSLRPDAPVATIRRQGGQLASGRTELGAGGSGVEPDAGGGAEDRGPVKAAATASYTAYAGGDYEGAWDYFAAVDKKLVSRSDYARVMRACHGSGHTAQAMSPSRRFPRWLGVASPQQTGTAGDAARSLQ